MKIMTKLLLLPCLIASLSLLNACSSGRYHQKHDSTPSRLPTQAELKDALPRAEAHSRGGNKNYQVFGKPYKVLATAQGFEETGLASWYGEKFHGHLTSNGEIYDMYAMTAAHKNLPLPTYLKVTNTSNNKSVIVRVNDRGPFHQSRILDLSYSAAYKLDMLKTGTAQVKITAITDFYLNKEQVKVTPAKRAKDFATTSASLPKAEIPTKPVITHAQVKSGVSTPYIQVFATSKEEHAKSIANTLQTQYKQKTSYPEQHGVYRIQMGPFSDIATLNALLAALKKNGYPNAYPRSASKI